MYISISSIAFEKSIYYLLGLTVYNDWDEVDDTIGE